MKMKKIITCIALCSMVAGMAHATKWAPSATPPDVGYWNDASNWDAGYPVGDTKVQFSSSVLTECVVTNSVDAGQTVMGDGGDVTGKVSVRIANGGILNGTVLKPTSWVGIGYSRSTICVVEAGGLLNANTRVGVGMTGTGVGLLEVYGDVIANGNLQVGNSGDGTVMIYDGGTVSALGLEMSAAGGESLLDIWQTGELTLSGNASNLVAGFIASEKILGNRLAGNLNIDLVSTTPGVTNTVVSTPATIPNLAGLTPAEAADMLAVFGYVVGTTTEGSAPGGVTGLVIATDPAAGTAAVAPGSSINIVIQEAGAIPDVVGLDYADATNVIVAAGYVLGTQTETYYLDIIADLVTGQDPAGGLEAPEGTVVNIAFNERKGPETSINSIGIGGDWNTASTWSTGVVPWKETQNYQVQISAGDTVTLTNFVAMRRIHVGHNGTGVAQLDVMAGGHVLAGFYDNYAAVGWNKDCILNVYTNGIFESREALRVGWDGSSATINIDGGTVLAPNSWMSLGRSDRTNSVTGVPYTSEINIMNGGSLLVNYLRNEGYDYGVINVAGGSFATTGTDQSDIDNGLLSGFIAVADGYEQSLKVINGNYTLTTYLPGYEGWSGLWGVDIGGENDDFDDDLRENLYEYALNGDPTDPLDAGSEPVFVKNGDTFDYSHLLRTDYDGLVYTVQTKQDLVNDVEWQDAGILSTSTNVTGSDYNVLTNSISTVEGHKFIRLEITNP